MEPTSYDYNPYAREIYASGKAQFELIDVDAAELSTASANTAAVSFTDLAQVTDKITENTRKLADLEQDLWLLDGSFSLPTKNESNGETGYWSNVLSDENGNIDVLLTFTFDTLQSSKGFTVIFDTKTQEIASDFSIFAYNDDTLINSASITNNADVVRIVECQADGYNKIELQFTKTAKPFRRIRLTEFVFGFLQEFKADKIVSIKAIYETSLYMETMPTNKLEFTVDNTDRAYNVLNPTGVYAFLQNGQGINASITINGDTVSLGRFYFNNATANNNALTATIVGYDPIYSLDQTTYAYVADNLTRVEYIQSSGTQYIDTGFTPNQNTRIVIDYQYEGSDIGNQVIFGARSSTTSDAYVYYASNAGYWKTGYGTVLTDTTITHDTERHILDNNKNIVILDGETIFAHDEATFTCPNSMGLFCTIDAGTAKFFAKVRIYSCKIYDNGTLARNFVPCKDASGAGCLFDLVNKQFYTNKGTGTFAVGLEINTGQWTLSEAVQAVVDDSGVDLTVNIDAEIGARVIGRAIPKGTSHREALRMIAQAGMTNLYVNRLNQLVAKDFDLTNAVDTLTASNMLDYGEAQDAGLINTVILTVTDSSSEKDEVTYTASNRTAEQPYRAITVSNPLATSKAVADWILAAVSRRNKYTLRTMGNPARDIADCISIANVYGTTENAIVLRQETIYDGSVLDNVMAR